MLTDNTSEKDYSIRDLVHAPEPPQQHDYPPRRASLNLNQQRNRLWSADDGAGSPQHSSFRPRLFSAGSDRVIQSSRKPDSAAAAEDVPATMRRHSEPVTSSEADVSRSAASTLQEKKQITGVHMLHIPELDDNEDRRASDNDDEKDDPQQEWSVGPDLSTHSTESKERVGRPRSHTAVSVLSYGSSAMNDESGRQVDEDNTEADEDYNPYDGENRRRLPFGYEVPSCCRLPKLNELSVMVVKYAPCFLVIGLKQVTDRKVLGRLNILLVFFSAFQMAVGVFLAVILWDKYIVDRTLPPEQEDFVNDVDEYEEESATGTMLGGLWNLNFAILIASVVGAFIFISALLTWRVIRYVNLVGAIRYLWALAWTLPFETYAVISLFDYFNVMWVWVRHVWTTSQMAWIRKIYCNPSDTYRTRCVVPLSVNGTRWCLELYNNTDCVQIRDEAQAAAFRALNVLYYFSAGWGVGVLLLLCLTINTLERIVSRPLVQKSRQANISAWLSLPAIGCVTIGTLFMIGRQTALNNSSATHIHYVFVALGPLYLAAGGLFSVADFLGWVISSFPMTKARHKRRKVVAIYCFIGCLLLAVGTLVAVLCVSVAFSSSVSLKTLSDSTRGDVACFFNTGKSCTRCDEDVRRCPEWTEQDAASVLETQGKSSATLAAIFTVYALGSIQFGFNIRKHISTYQIDSE